MQQRLDIIRSNESLPEAVIFAIDPAFLSKVMDVRRYVLANGRKHLAIESEPDAWLPAGIETRLAVDEVSLVVDRDSIWMSAHSRVLDQVFRTHPVSLGSLGLQT